MNIYIVTYDSRYPTKHIPLKRFKTTSVSTLYRMDFLSAKITKLTPPILLSEFSGIIPLNALVYVRDIGAENFLALRNIHPTKLEPEGFLDPVINLIKTVIWGNTQW